jgi:hypothetical protein
MPGASDGEATERAKRRLDEPPPNYQAHRPPTVLEPTRLRPRSGRRKNIRLGVFGGAILVVVVMASMQWNFKVNADKLRSDLQTERISNLEDACQALTNGMHLPFLLWGVQSELRPRLSASADRVIREFRDNIGRRVAWTSAREKLRRSLEFGSGDAETKGRLRLCDAPLDGVNKQVRASAAEFNESAELLKNSPDPYLGLAVLYCTRRKRRRKTWTKPRPR